MNKPKVLPLDPEHRTQLEELAKSSTTPILTAQRARILLAKAEGRSNDSIAEELGIDRRTVMLWSNKYRNRKPDDSLDDILNVAQGRGCKEEITGEAKAWLISVAGMKPSDLGHEAGIWTAESLARYIREHASEAGFERLSTISTSGVYRILDKNNVKPFRIQYYCERRDPDNGRIMHDLVLMHRQLPLQSNDKGNLISIASNAGNGTITNYCKSRCIGTLSLFAGIDQKTSETIPHISDEHGSTDFIEFLKKLDARYPKEDRISLLLDDLPVYSSQQVKGYLSTVPDRFGFSRLPSRASWLKIIEDSFNRMTGQMLHAIRAKTKAELEESIYKYFEEFNKTPVDQQCTDSPEYSMQQTQSSIPQKTGSWNEKEGNLLFSDEITDVAYGQYALLQHLSKDVLEKLRSCFDAERATQIYSYALILCANGFLHVDQMDELYRTSIMAVQYKDFAFRMGSTALSSLLQELGSRTNPVRRFRQALVDDSSRNVAINGHVIRSSSEENCLGEPDYSLNMQTSPNVIIMSACDVKNKFPLMYRTYREFSLDSEIVVDFLEECSLHDTNFLVNKALYSKDVLNLMSENGNRYTILLSNENEDVKRIWKTLEFTSGEFLYGKGREDTELVVYYEDERKADGKTRIIAFKDLDENNSMRKDYQYLIETGESGYTKEKYEKYAPWWGVFFLQTTSQETAPAIFSDYKDQCTQACSNSFLNDADFNDPEIQDYYNAHGFDFIMLVAGLIQSRLSNAVKALHRSTISTKEVLIKASKMRMVLHDDQWHLHNTITKDIELLKEMGFTPELSYPAGKKN